MRRRLEWLEAVVVPGEVTTSNDGPVGGIAGSRDCWWVDVDRKTGVAYAYIAGIDCEMPWLQNDELPEKP